MVWVGLYKEMSWGLFRPYSNSQITSLSMKIGSDFFPVTLNLKVILNFLSEQFESRNFPIIVVHVNFLSPLEIFENGNGGAVYSTALEEEPKGRKSRMNKKFKSPFIKLRSIS